MNSIDAPQIFEYKSEALNVTPYDVKWLPYSATAVMIGQTAKMEGCIQFYRMQNQKLEKIFSQNFGKGLKTCSWNMYQGDISGKLFIFDMEKEKKIYEVQAHQGMINKIDSVGGVIGKGPVEIVTGGSDGKVQLFDPRQTDPVLTLKPSDKNNNSIPDCWAVALGNVENHQERCIAAGYDDGDMKIFDLRKNILIMDENLKNGICGLEFDRKDIQMNKIIATSLEGKIYAYDLRTNHPTEGFSSMQKKISDATIWGVKHSPHNREIFMAQGGDGNLHLFKYNYPTKRFIIDAENRKKGVMGEIELLNEYKISDQPAIGFDWNNDKQGLAITCAIDQKLKVIVITKLEKYDQLISNYEFKIKQNIKFENNIITCLITKTYHLNIIKKNKQRPKSSQKIYYKKLSTGDDQPLYHSNVYEKQSNQLITSQQFNEMKCQNPKLTLKLKADQYHTFNGIPKQQNQVYSMQGQIGVDRIEYLKRMSKVDIKSEFIQMFERISQNQQHELNKQVQELSEQQKPLFMKHQLIQEAFVNPAFKEKIYPIQRKIQSYSVKRSSPLNNQNNNIQSGINNDVKSQNYVAQSQNSIIDEINSQKALETKIKTSAQKLTDKINKRALKKFRKQSEQLKENQKKNEVEKELDFNDQKEHRSATIDKYVSELDTELNELKNLEQDFDDDSVLYYQTDKILEEIYVQINESMRDMQQFPGDEHADVYSHKLIDGDIQNIQRNFSLKKGDKVFEVLENVVIFEYNKITTQIIKENNSKKQNKDKQIERITETFLDHYDNIKEQKIQEYVIYKQVNEKLKSYYQDLETEEVKIDKIDDEKQTATLTNVYCKTEVDPDQGKMLTRTTRFTNTQPLTEKQINQLKQVSNNVKQDQKIVRTNVQELTEEEKEVKIEQLEKKIAVCEILQNVKNIDRNLSMIYKNLKDDAVQDLLKFRDEYQNQKLYKDNNNKNNLELQIVSRSQKIINTLEFSKDDQSKRFSLADKIDVLFSKQKGTTKRIKLDDVQLFQQQNQLKKLIITCQTKNLQKKSGSNMTRMKMDIQMLKKLKNSLMMYVVKILDLKVKENNQKLQLIKMVMVNFINMK